MKESTVKGRKESCFVALPVEKLKYAQLVNRFDGLGVDLFACGVNALLFQGGLPRFCALSCLLINQEICEGIEGEILRFCEENNCVYKGRIVEEDLKSPAVRAEFWGERKLPVAKVEAGDKVLGLLTDGVHNSGFHLLEKLFSTEDKVLMEAFDKQFFSTAEEELLKPTALYAGLGGLVEKGLFKSGAAVLGSGVTGAVCEALKEGVGAVLEKSAYKKPILFETLQLRAGLDDERAYKTFTMGIGGVLIVGRGQADGVLAELKNAGIEACILGETVAEKGVFWI